jgi:hypothetical protein
MGFDGLLDLSPSSVTFLMGVSIDQCGRSKCREGVTEIGNVQNDEPYTVQFMAVIWIARVRNIQYLPINQDSYSKEV